MGADEERNRDRLCRRQQLLGRVWGGVFWRRQHTLHMVEQCGGEDGMQGSGGAGAKCSISL